MTPTNTDNARQAHESAACALYDHQVCRSCTLLARNDGNRILLKEDSLAGILSHYRLTPQTIEPIYLPANPWGSRTKLKLLVGGSADSPQLGIADSQFGITDLTECPLPMPQLGGLLQTLKQVINTASLTPYSIAERSGELKGIVILSNVAGTEAILRFVLRSSEAIPRIRKVVTAIQAEHPWIKVVSCNIQPKPAAIPEGPIEEILTQESTITERYGNFSVVFGPQSFMQVTHECASALYRRAGELVQKINPDSVLDLFCGVGGFSFAVAPFARSVLGLELSKNAVECATLGASLNRFQHIEFLETDLTESLNAVRQSSAQVVIVNPPRRGLSSSLCELLRDKASLQHVVYSSCNPETHCRDLELLSPAYELALIAPFDMFPLTTHIEVLAHLRRRS